MRNIDTVSETALLTLRSRVIEATGSNPVLVDPVGRECLEKLVEIIHPEIRDRIMERKLSPLLTRHLALRARKYDQFCREFLEEYPGGLIVNLGCGFDTRFWRLEMSERQYLELDLPEVIQLKKEILGDRIKYRTIEESVLEGTWITEVRSIQETHLLFLAEGLFMYFPPEDSVRTLKAIGASFQASRLVMEVVHEKYTRGTYKKMVERKMRKRAGSAAGDYFQFGIRKGSDLEGYHPSYIFRNEWSFFEDRDIRPSFLRAFKNIRSVAKSQYTVMADIS